MVDTTDVFTVTFILDEAIRISVDVVNPENPTRLGVIAEAAYHIRRAQAIDVSLLALKFIVEDAAGNRLEDDEVAA